MTVKINSLQQYYELKKLASENPDAFWAEQANIFHWVKPFDKVCGWDFEGPEVKWFLNGKTNIAYNCLDRHIEERGDKTALIWEPNEPGEELKKFSYRELLAEVNKCANGLKELGIEK